MKLRRVRGMLQLQNGGQLPIKSRHVANALASHQQEIQGLRELVDLKTNRLRMVEKELAELRAGWWTRLGRKLGMLK